MIDILLTSQQAKDCTQFLQSRNLPLHDSMEKNWDHYELCKLVEDMPKSSAILDMGSGHGFTLRLLNLLGFDNLTGIDTHLSSAGRFDFLTQWLKKGFRPASVIKKGDLCDTKLPGGSFDLLTCISVIEHGVDIDAFVKESARLLSCGGTLWVTFDYWDPANGNPKQNKQIFGLPWIIFDRPLVQYLIDRAAENGLELSNPKTEIPPCQEQTVLYEGMRYTFMGIAFRRV